MASSDPKVSIVVTALNAEKSIANCLRSLNDQDYHNLEIILVDGGSTDATVKVAQQVAGRQSNFRLVVDNTSATPARGRNIGSKFATGQLLAFTDSDCAAEPNWIRVLAGPENWREDTGGVGGKTVFTRIPEGQIALKALHGAIGTRLGSGGSAQFLNNGTRTRVRSLPSCNVMYRMETFASHGGFDESLRYCEDSALNARIRRSGLNLSYIPEAVVHHRHRDSAMQFARWIFEYGKGRASALKKDSGAFSYNVALLALAAVVFLVLAILRLAPISILILSVLALYSTVALCSAFFSSGKGLNAKFFHFAAYFVIHFSYLAGLVVGVARGSSARVPSSSRKDMAQ